MRSRRQTETVADSCALPHAPRIATRPRGARSELDTTRVRTVRSEKKTSRHPDIHHSFGPDRAVEATATYRIEAFGVNSTKAKPENWNQTGFHIARGGGARRQIIMDDADVFHPSPEQNDQSDEPDCYEENWNACHFCAGFDDLM